jgi:hypothetical protein
MQVKVQCLQICCYAVPHNLLEPLVLFFLQALGMETQRYCSVNCALTDWKSVAGLTVYSLCKSTVMEKIKFRSGGVD